MIDSMLTNVFWVRCDRCETAGPEKYSIGEALKAARHESLWAVRSDGTAFCPDCIAFHPDCIGVSA